MNKFFDKYLTTYLLLIFLILLPLLTMAISNDVAIFMTAGKTIFEGKKIYVDYFDIKPPFFFQIYAGIYAVLGFSEIAPRFADLIIQLVTSIFIYKIFSNFTSNKFYRWIPGIIYSMVYVSLSSSQTGYPESFLGIFLASILYIIHQDKWNYKSVIYLAIIIGLAIAMKYSFVVALFPFIIYAIFSTHSSLKIKFKFSFLIIAISTFVAIFTHFQIYFDNSLEAFQNFMLLLFKYSNIHPSPTQLLKKFFETNSEFWGFQISALVSFGVLITLYRFISKDFALNRKFILLIFVMLLFLFISIVIEKKFSVYMYSRLLVPSILLSSYGIISLLDKFKEFNYYKNLQFVLVFSISLLIFSPFLKYSKSLINSYLYLTNTTKYNESYEINSYGYSRTKYLEIAEYVRKTTQKNDKVLVIGNGSNILSYFLADYKQYPFAQSMYFLGDLNIDSYKKIMEKELNEAEILIFNTFDAHTDISGNVESSFELIQKDIQYNSILNNQFHYEITFDNFIIYRKNP